MSNGAGQVLVVAMRQAKPHEVAVGRVGYIGLDLVEDDVPAGCESSVSPDPIILCEVPELFWGICREILNDAHVLRVQMGRRSGSVARWPRTLHTEGDLRRFRASIVASGHENQELLYPISIWGLPEGQEERVEGLIAAFQDEPDNESLLAQIFSSGVVRVSLFKSSLSVSLPPLLLERGEEWLRRVTATLPVRVLWQE